MVFKGWLPLGLYLRRVNTSDITLIDRAVPFDSPRITKTGAYVLDRVERQREYFMSRRKFAVAR